MQASIRNHRVGASFFDKVFYNGIYVTITGAYVTLMGARIITFVLLRKLIRNSN